MVLGGLSLILGLMANGTGILIGLAAVIIALPLVLARKHPWLICGWVITALCYAFFNPFVTATPRSLAAAVHHLILALLYPEHGLLRGGPGIGAAIAIFRGLFAILLLFLTVRAWCKRKQ